MCGLVCLVAGRGEAANPSIVERMLAPIFHRGPNDEGLAFDREFGAGFRRLSILDLTPAGHQPMRSQGIGHEFDALEGEVDTGGACRFAHL